MLTAMKMYACHAVQKPKLFFKRGLGMGGGVDWLVTHILVNPITWYLRRLKLCERLEYATITLHIISYTPNRVVVEDTVFFVQCKRYTGQYHT